MRKTIRATILVLTLCGSTLAGDMSTPPVVGPDDAPGPLITPQTSGEQTADGIIHGDNADSVAAAATTLLNSVLALL